MFEILEAGSRFEFNYLRRVNIAVATSSTANTRNTTFQCEIQQSLLSELYNSSYLNHASNYNCSIQIMAQVQY